MEFVARLPDLDVSRAKSSEKTARRFLSNFKEPFSPKTASNEKSHIFSHNYFLRFNASLLQIFFTGKHLE